jgi:hypothetical protein
MNQSPVDAYAHRAWIEEMRRIIPNLRAIFDPPHYGCCPPYRGCINTAALIAAAGARFDLEMEDA